MGHRGGCSGVGDISELTHSNKPTAVDGDIGVSRHGGVKYDQQPTFTRVHKHNCIVSSA